MVAILPLVVGAAAGGHWLVDPPSTPVTVTDAVVGGRPAVVVTVWLRGRIGDGQERASSLAAFLQGCARN